MIHPISIHDLMSLPALMPLADVRTPAEFAQGHIPGAFNLPLFSNEERVIVGTTYKQAGKEAAILLGFDLTGAKWSGFIRQALAVAPQKKIAVHCWRGGMRSGAMAWALDLYGFEVYLVQGGYKQYRQWALSQFDVEYPLIVLGGMTGSGKTRILQAFQRLGHQIVDLEDLAQHRGSAYGSMNSLVQPTQEQFENNLAGRLHQLDKQLNIWVEDESSTIGKCMIPRSIWNQMSIAFLLDIQVDAVQRIEALVREYGGLDKDFLVASTERIRKRLGHDHTKTAITAIQEGRMKDFIREIVTYYDKVYSRRAADRILTVTLEEQADHEGNARKILEAVPFLHPANK